MEPLTFPDNPSVTWDWNRGLTNGLLGYIGLQVILSFILGRTVEGIVLEWPIYAFYAALWTVVFALGFSTGASWGIVIATLFVDLLIFGTQPVFSSVQAFDRALTNLFADLVVLGVVGLIRGRLEWIGLHNRYDVAKIFGWAGSVLVASVILGLLMY